MSDPRRIDVHQHVIPERYRAWLESRVSTGTGGFLPRWSAADALAVMDSNGISTGVLSLCVPGVHSEDGAEALKLAHQVNEFSAELVKDRPDRFGFFAASTLPDVDNSLTAVLYALDELKADGVGLLANHQGRYLGDPMFEPLMAELNCRSAVVHIHPTVLPGLPVPGIGPAAADFLLDTTRAAINLVRTGTTRRYPDIKFILSHAGGFLPYAAHRIAGWLAAYGIGDATFSHDSPDVNRLADEAIARTPDVLHELAGFYFDTALSSTPTTLPSLLAFARPGHVLFGSDWPFAHTKAVGTFNDTLDSYDGLDDGQRDAINHGNAKELFPRLA